MEGILNSILQAIYNSLIVDKRWIYLWDGLKITLIVTFFALIIGLGLGFLIAIVRSSYKDLKPSWSSPKGFLLSLANTIFSAFVTFIRGTPTTIQLLIMFNIIMVNLDNLVIVAIATFGLNSAAYISEIFRGGIQTVSKGEREAARSLGMSYGQSLQKVVLPQAFKNSLPGLGNEVITLLKETSISGFIGLADLTRGAGIIISQTFSATIPYFAAALIYLLLVLGLEKIFAYLERKNQYA